MNESQDSIGVGAPIRQRRQPPPVPHKKQNLRASPRDEITPPSSPESPWRHNLRGRPGEDVPPLPSLAPPKKHNLRARPREESAQSSIVPELNEIFRARQRKEVAAPSPPRRSLTADITNDCWRLLRTGLKLPGLLYPVWKWLLLFYIMWMSISYAIVLTYQAVSDVLVPACSIPILGPRLPFCAFIPSGDQPFNASKLAASQDGFAIVMDEVGQNYDLARDMVGHEFALRDLRIRVAASGLSRKREIVRELESLIRITKQTSKDISRFTARVGKSIDTVYTFDNYAVRTLEAIAERRDNPPSLSSRIVSSLSPLSAFSLTASGGTEAEVKEVFIYTASKISTKVKVLLDDSFELEHGFYDITETLERIKELVNEELGDMPHLNILAALWQQLARPDDHEAHVSHSSLLNNLQQFYHEASHVMEHTQAALNQINSEMEIVRDDFATPALTLEDHPLEIIIEQLRNTGKRLEAGRNNLVNY